MIVSFGDGATEDLFHNRITPKARRFPVSIVDPALAKLDMLNASSCLLDLRAPPGNRLKALKGDLKGFYSIRVNEQWRIVLHWEGGNAHDVQLTDYHQ